MKNFEGKVKSKIADIQAKSPALTQEFKNIRKDPHFREQAAKLASKLPPAEGGLEKTQGNFALETIVLRVGRPVLSIFKDDAILEFKEAESLFWKEKLTAAEPLLKEAIQSIGRIELQNDLYYDWVGTGWLVAPDTIVTNRHVAEVFGKADGVRFVFRQGRGGGDVSASIDFLEEAGRPDTLSFAINKILHIEKDGGPDLAFLQVTVHDGADLHQPIKLLTSNPVKDQEIAVIGYPARDSRIPDQQLMLDIFGDVYDKKRLSPGTIIDVSGNLLLHDCSTLGGNSGSALIDLKTGNSVGIHFAGRFLESNSAVPAAIIDSKLKSYKTDNKITISKEDTRPTAPATSADLQIKNLVQRQITLSYNIPISVTFSVGDILGGNNANGININTANNNQDEPDEFITEAKSADYSDREGYTPDFLGDSIKVPLPKITGAKQIKDTLKFGNEQILKYEHFSVVMSKSRRQCFFSAVNIDGKSSKEKTARGPWRLDPRIPEEAQIMKECYGNAPKFSRGHMTRREDPIWGKAKDAALGNADSMHVTNTVPQMQNLNAGIWLSLENYALKNARADDMRICVFTGPVFKTDDPIRDGVKIPLSFWKVISFIHDETEKLCATGYWISQKEFLSAEEFVFGKFKTYQKKIADIEKITGLSFGKLTALDPYKEVDELPDSFLMDLEQIKFI